MKIQEFFRSVLGVFFRSFFDGIQFLNNDLKREEKNLIVHTQNLRVFLGVSGVIFKF